MPEKINYLQIGLGEIGVGVVRLAMKRTNLRLVGAVDIDPRKHGKDVGELLDGEPIGIPIVSALKEVAFEKEPEVAILTTGSHLPDISGQLREIAEAGLDIISSSEELFYPYARRPEFARELHELAVANSITILGVGVNPGFVMDVLPVLLTYPSAEVQSIRVERIVNLSERREALQKKMGIGLSVDQFKKDVDAGKLGHVGLPESVYFIADVLGWKVEEIREKIEPIVALEDLAHNDRLIKKGQVVGTLHTCTGLQNGKERIELNLQMYLNAERPRDRITVQGDPLIDCEIERGIFGDTATAAILVNSIPLVIHSSPGLKTMADILPVHYWPER